MGDNSKGSAYERYAAVNSLILDTYSQKCLDFKYQNFVDGLRQVNWNQSAAEGG